MSGPDPVWGLRRILVALDASPDSLAALTDAVALARRTEAELLGLFVEDIGLLGIAASPLAREVGFHSAEDVPLSRSRMECTLRSQSELARKALEAAAREAQVRWSFRTVRGRVASELLAAAAEVDLLAMGTLGWSVGSQLRIGSAAMELAASGVPLLLSSGRRSPARSGFCVYCDGSASARRAFEIAREFAAPDKRSLVALIAAEDAGKRQSIRRELDERAKESETRLRCFDLEGKASLFEALRVSGDGIFVVGGPEPFKRLPWLEAALRKHRIPLLLLRDGS